MSGVGPRIRTDLVDVYLFRWPEQQGVELLQLHRTGRPTALAPNTWQPVMGHVEPGETAVEAAIRETLEETGLDLASIADFWQLEQVHPFFIAETNTIYLSPRFAALVPTDWEPLLNADHDGYRWAPLDEAADHFIWPGQQAVINEIRKELLPADSPARAALRVRR